MATIAKEVKMTAIRDKMAAELPKWSKEIQDLVKQYGDVKISDVSIAQAYGGMRGVKGLVCDTSDVPPDKGLIIRGRPVADLVNNTPEEVFWLLLTGEMPTKEEVADLSRDLKSRAKVPDYVWKVLEAMPKDSHPMAMFDTAILVMERESKFREHYDAGMPKSEYWIWTLEDALDIVAKLPEIAAGVYRMKFDKGPRIAFDPSLDWSQNYVKMLGSAGSNRQVCRLHETVSRAAFRPRIWKRQRAHDVLCQLRAFRSVLLALCRTQWSCGTASRPCQSGMPALGADGKGKIRRRSD